MKCSRCQRPLTIRRCLCGMTARLEAEMLRLVRVVLDGDAQDADRARGRLRAVVEEIDRVRRERARYVMFVRTLRRSPPSRRSVARDIEMLHELSGYLFPGWPGANLKAVAAQYRRPPAEAEALLERCLVFVDRGRS